MLGTKSFSESYSYRKNDGALDHIDTATGDTVSYGYDALKRVNSVTTKNSAGQTLLTQSNTFQSLDSTRTSSRLSTYTVKGANQQTIVGNRYSYDPSGNITKIEEANGSGYRVIAEYVYDWMDQLCKETRYTYNGTSSTVASTTVIEYASDTAGNLRSVKVNGTETLSYTYGDSAWADKLTKITVNGKSKTIQYADALNPGNWYNGTDYTNLTWTQGRRLSSITKGSSTYSYEYDMSGVRSVKIVDGWKHEYVTQNGRVIRDKVTDASTGAFQYVLEFGYDESGRPLTLRWYYNEAETWYNAYYYICNAQGDVVNLVSDSGATIAAYSYDAWGTLLSIQGESNGDAFIAYANPLRYRGYYYDTETGFYYLQSRYYDPIVKRFLNADSYGSTGQGFLGFNMFAYCNNNPVVNHDPTGHNFLRVLLNEIKNAVRVALLYAKYGSPSSKIGAARDYVSVAGSNDQNAPNCYAFSEGEDRNDQPGKTCGRGLADYTIYEVGEVYSRVKHDQIEKGRSVRPLNGPDDLVFPTEYKVALRVGTGFYTYYYEYNEKIYEIAGWDYHFMVQVSDGSWAEKHGIGGDSICHPVGLNPDIISWDLGNLTGYYDSPIIYYAVGG